MVSDLLSRPKSVLKVVDNEIGTDPKDIFPIKANTKMRTVIANSFLELDGFWLLVINEI
jgi:hypothetical protein